jgi:hypothetical protein
MILIAASAIVALRATRQRGRRAGAVRWSLAVLTGGLIGYDYLATGFPGAAAWLGRSGLGGVLLAVLLGEAVGLAGAWAWSRAK